MDNIIKLFEANSKKAMSESEAAISQRKWVKAERKETESETWQEAARILKKEQTILSREDFTEIFEKAFNEGHSVCLAQINQDIEYYNLYIITSRAYDEYLNNKKN